MERFTQRARNTLTLAQAEAELLQQRLIKPEHLLVALLQESEGVAGTVLREMGLTAEGAHEFARTVASPVAKDSKQPAELSDGVKRTLEAAVKQARQWDHHYIGTEHLLVGLVKQDGTTVRTYLDQLSITPDEVVERVQSIIGEPVKEKTPTVQRVQRFFNAMTPSFALSSVMTAPSRPEYMKVLELIEKGTISADDGVRLLRAMNPAPSFRYRRKKPRKD